MHHMVLPELVLNTIICYVDGVMLHMVLPELVLNNIICLGGRGYASYDPSRASSEYYYLFRRTGLCFIWSFQS